MFCCVLQPATPTRTTAATPVQSLPLSQTPPKRLDTPTLEEPSDLEELEQFAKTFKQRRIKLGFTQVCVYNWRDYICNFNYFFSSYFKMNICGYPQLRSEKLHSSCMSFSRSHLCTRGMLAWLWGSCMEMTSAKLPSPALRPWTWALRTCVNSSHCWRSGLMMQVCPWTSMNE